VRRLLAIALGAVLAGGLATIAASRDAGNPQRAGPAAATLRTAPEPALDIAPPQPLRRERHLTRWAPLRHGVVARARPAATAARVARLRRLTPEGTEHPVPILGRAVDGAGRAWLRVRLPVLPNGTTGWIPRRSVGGYVLVRHHLVVDRDRLEATLLRRGKPVLSVPIGIGQDRWPTPPGEYLVRNRLYGYDRPMYGPVAFGTSARSPTLTDWPAGGFVGIHGTDRPDLLPGRVSHGCIRMRNADIRRLARLMPIGTPVTIR
jgi:hypothetical protein